MFVRVGVRESGVPGHSDGKFRRTEPPSDPTMPHATQIDRPAAVVLGVLAYVVVKDELFVQELTVGRDARRLRLATSLIAHLLAARELGVRGISLVVSKANWAAVNLYARLGLQEALEERLVVPRSDQYYMRAEREVVLSQAEELILGPSDEEAQPKEVRDLHYQFYESRQRLALEGLRDHGPVLALVREAHGNSRTLPHDWNARHKVQYLLAKGILRPRSPRA